MRGFACARRDDLLLRATGVGLRRRGADDRAERRRHVLLRDAFLPLAFRDERRAVEQDRDVGVVVPRRPVHEPVERIGFGDDLAFARHDEHLPAAAGEIAAREHFEPSLAQRADGIGRRPRAARVGTGGRWRRRRGGRRSGAACPGRRGCAARCGERRRDDQRNRKRTHAHHRFLPKERSQVPEPHHRRSRLAARDKHEQRIELVVLDLHRFGGSELSQDFGHRVRVPDDQDHVVGVVAADALDERRRRVAGR